MATLVPFRALRPPPSLAVRVAAPPYDVVSTREARALAAGNADSFLHVSRPEIDLAVGVDEHAEEVYRQGRAALEGFVSRGVLRPDPEPRLYVYAQRMGDHEQAGIVGCASVDEHAEEVYRQGRAALEGFVARGVLQPDPGPRFYVYAQRMGAHEQAGLVACASVDEYDRDAIKKHEKTRADKEDDRVRHIDALSAHDEPVFLTYRARAAVDAAVAEVRAAAPEVDLVTADGVSHRLWVVPAAAGSTSITARMAARSASGERRSGSRTSRL